MKLFASDLDGTLLNGDHKISKENAEAIRKAQEQGVKVVVATGRSYNSARKPMAEVGLEAPVICLNGAQIYTVEGKLVRSVPLEKGVAMKIIEACRQKGAYFELFTNQGGFSSSREDFLKVMVDIMMSANPGLKEEEVKQHATKRFQEEEITIIENYEELVSRTDIEIYKVLAFSTTNTTLESVRNELSEETGVAITSSGFDNLEFNHPQAQKGIALELFAKDIDIDMKDVMAIGDNYNDVSMLQAAGMGVAMGNADEEIKQLSDFVTKTNLEHGVAYAIEEMLKVQK
ncbi:Cof-type HAD-IIB family hydrolase [Radiobacillus kanasensis]|uniref:Cof-type HAD-IIB family hydrolase n=1 Tax=Radiobacillus kanasensis TaxID=2844358 RepID=UPI001E4F135A|nr:Cof-type HAD-IIB family hydrolase [Radiobacillus kanasensis]UFU00683.1 Cof-type HAD-IIB family hydrolase [Radiobacillus kanasensis]